MSALGRMLVAAGLALAVIGLLVGYGARLPIRIGRLPGDFVWRGKNSVFYFPLATSILISVVLSLVMWLFGRTR
jgi:ribose/xylose/arabinose/galactoside ABC-type transport system permease subunit